MKDSTNIDEDRITNNAVTIDKLRNNAVITAKLGDEKVTTAKLLDDAITPAKLINIVTARLCDYAVTRSKCGLQGRDIYYECVNGIEVRRSDADIRYWESVSGCGKNAGCEKNAGEISDQANGSPLPGEVEVDSLDSN